MVGVHGAPAHRVGPVQRGIEGEDLRGGQDQEVELREQPAQRLVPGRAHARRVVELQSREAHAVLDLPHRLGLEQCVGGRVAV